MNNNVECFLLSSHESNMFRSITIYNNYRDFSSREHKIASGFLIDNRFAPGCIFIALYLLR